MLARISPIVRSFTTSAIRQGAHTHGGTPGENLPFGITNRYRLTAWFVVYFTSGFGLPFFVLRHQLLKK